MKPENPFIGMFGAIGDTSGSPVPTSPFTGIVESLPASGYARPEAQAWLAQALGSPYMQGWGGPAPTSGMAPGAGSAGPNTVTDPTTGESRPRLASEITASPEAKKMLRKFRKAKKANDFGLDDAAMLAANVALGVATGGTSLAAQVAGGALGGATSLYGSDKTNKAIASQVNKIKKLRNTTLGELGYDKRKSGWYDTEGTKLGGKNVFQILLDAGVLG